MASWKLVVASFYLDGELEVEWWGSYRMVVQLLRKMLSDLT